MEHGQGFRLTYDPLGPGHYAVRLNDQFIGEVWKDDVDATLWSAADPAGHVRCDRATNQRHTAALTLTREPGTVTPNPDDPFHGI